MSIIQNKYHFLFALVFGLTALMLPACKDAEGTDEDKNYSTIQYEPSMEIFPNPERGFIHMVDVHSEGENLNPLWLASLRAESVSMIMRVYYFDDFKDKPLSDAELLLIRTDMQYLRAAGIKVVLRFAYTDNMEVSDAPLSIVEQHLEQLKPVFEENKDVIAFVQAGFIGAWGEWHSSSNGLATVDNERKVLFKLLSVLPGEIMVQVRTPGAKQQIFNTTAPVDASIAYSNEYRARVGHHNDCFLAGGTDYGTYNNIAADKEYISKDALYVPTGGETCPPENAFPGCSTAQTEMKLLKWTFLNLDWYQPVLQAWRNSGCFEEFQRNLGYRLTLMSARLPKEVVSGSDWLPTLKITNKGYAPVYNYKIVNLLLQNSSTAETFSFQVPVDIRSCKPNGVLTIENPIKLNGVPAGIYNTFLQITDQSEGLKNRKEFAIRLANKNVWNDEHGWNDLQHQLKVISGK